MTSLTHDSMNLATLQGLIDRLTDPNLTVSEANDLRPRLFDLLQSIGGADPAKNPADHTVGRVA